MKDPIINSTIKELEKNYNKENIDGMNRFGITCKNAYGIKRPILYNIIRELKKKIPKEKRDQYARNFWNFKYHETKIIAANIATKEIGWKTIEDWIKNSENWAEIDTMCSKVVWKLKNTESKALEYSKAKSLWKKRTGFVLMAILAIRFKEKLDVKIINKFLEAIERESTDERNFIKKAVNWALRQIGKSCSKYYKRSLRLAKKLSQSKDKTARWIGSDAYRELDSRWKQFTKLR